MLAAAIHAPYDIRVEEVSDPSIMVPSIHRQFSIARSRSKAYPRDMPK